MKKKELKKLPSSVVLISVLPNPIKQFPGTLMQPQCANFYELSFTKTYIESFTILKLFEKKCA